MTITESETASAAQALALLALPKFNQLTEGQVRGVTCVWDASEEPLADEEAVDLGPRRVRRLDGHFDWQPRGCREHVGQAAMIALSAHCISNCQECGARDADGVAIPGSCDTGRALLLVHRRTVRL